MAYIANVGYGGILVALSGVKCMPTVPLNNFSKLRLTASILLTGDLNETDFLDVSPISGGMRRRPQWTSTADEQIST